LTVSMARADAMTRPPVGTETKASKFS